MPFDAFQSLLRGLAGASLLLALAACGGGGDDLLDEGPPRDIDGPTYTVSGNIEGLQRSVQLVVTIEPEGNIDPGLVITETRTVNNGSFRLDSQVPQGWVVYIRTEDLWRRPYQNCVVSRTGGSMPEGYDAQFGPVDADVTDLHYRCGRGYAVNGIVTGDVGPAPASGQPPLFVSVNTPFPGLPRAWAQSVSVFAPGPFDMVRDGASNSVPILAGTPYNVTTFLNSDRTCSVTNGSGTMPERDVDDVVVDCREGVEVRFKVVGLKGVGLRVELRTEAPDPAPPGTGPRLLDTMDVAADGDHVFDAKAYPGHTYLVGVVRQPAGPAQECTVLNGTGTVPQDDPVTDVEIRCPQPEKTWRYDGADTLFTETPLSGGSAGYTVVDERFDPPLAPTNVTLGVMVDKQNVPLFQNLFDLPGTNMAVYSSADGSDYRIATEAASSTDPRITSIRTRWWLRKTSPATEVRFLLTHVYLDAAVDNAGSGRYAARQLNARAWIELRGHSISAVDGGVNPVPFHAAVGHVELTARRLENDLAQWNVGFGSDAAATVAVFKSGDLEADLSHTSPLAGGYATVKLLHPVELAVNLDGVPVGQRVLVEMIAAVQAQNGYSRESHVVAYLRDPATFEPGAGPAALELVALEGVSVTEPGHLPPGFAPQPDTTPAAACTAPGAPRATLQFAAPTFSVPEGDPTNRSVVVTRSGSSAGALTARVSLQPGTATPGLDYRAGDVVVRFADGDTTPRTVQVPVLQDSEAEGAETILLTLSDVAGCADPGAQSSATLTVADDEDPPPAPPSGTLDAGFGTNGRATLPGFGGENTALALQPDGRILMAGGSFSDFVLARFNADGSVDTGFGGRGTGTVETDIAGGFQQEQARAIAVQPDGRIIVAGEATPAGGGQATRMALVRYLPDGSLDASFGDAGKVFAASPAGRIWAIALEPDGRFVVAGDVILSGTVNNDFGDMMIARYLPSGALDPSFGTGGRTVVDITGTTDLGRHLLRLPDGSYIVSGDAVGAFAEPTAVARFTPSGQLDPGFGQQGRLAIGGVLVGQGLARQADGKLVLVGSVGAGPAARFAVMRLNADGSTDTGFGSAGLASLTFSGNTDRAQAVALQPDGRIVVAGETGGLARDVAVARLLADGTLDPAFDGDGKLNIDFANDRDEAERVSIQPDGRILLGGWTRDRSGVPHYALVRLLP